MYFEKKRREWLFFLYIAESWGGSGSWFSITGRGEYDADEKSDGVDEVVAEGACRRHRWSLRLRTSTVARTNQTPATTLSSGSLGGRWLWKQREKKEKSYYLLIRFPLVNLNHLFFLIIYQGLTFSRCRPPLFF